MIKIASMIESHERYGFDVRLTNGMSAFIGRKFFLSIPSSDGEETDQYFRRTVRMYFSGIKQIPISSEEILVIEK